MVLRVVLLLILLGLAAAAVASPIVDPSILSNLARKGYTTNVLLSFKAANVTGARQLFRKEKFTDRGSRLTGLFNTLKRHADEVQFSVLKDLDRIRARKPIEIRQLWITCQIIVRGVDRETADELIASEDISAISREVFYPIDEPIDLIIHPNVTIPNKAGEQWGVVAIQAPQVWSAGYRGAGAVIATIDTGVRVTHEALRNNFRSNYGWYDPYQRTVSPNDQNGHGTHTTGTIAGAYGIGVAPNARWISCKGCSTNGCSNFALLECGQWTVCPTNTNGYNPNCALAPNAVSNSWGGGQGSTWYNQVIATWKAADIAPLFSIGNSGPRCGTANTPGDSVDAIAVGSTTSFNQVSSFSSVGPTYSGRRTKPDIAAPGSSILSAYHTSDTAYATLSGTSMACPHAAGLSALLYGASPNLSYYQIKSFLIGGCQPTRASGYNCGGLSESYYPNNHVGYGRISASASFQKLLRTLPRH